MANKTIDLKPYLQKESFSIIWRADSEFDEVVDSLADVFQVTIAVERALQDGFDIADLLVAVQQEPTVREVLNDAPIFLRQFKALTATTARNAVILAKQAVIERTGALGVFTIYVMNTLWSLADSYAVGLETIQQGQRVLNNYKAISAGVDIVPNEPIA